jgi:hydroxymethylpyrimidine pyrophosphatase-like HAD family hydrolase
MLMLRLIILDIEGVVTAAGGSQFPWPLAEMAEARRLLEESPVPCVLCSGRQVPYGEAVAQALNLFRSRPEDARAAARQRGAPELFGWPSVLENGAYLYDAVQKRPLPHPTLTPARIQRLHALRAERIDPLMARTGANLDVGKDFCVSINPPPAAPGARERMATDTFRTVVEEELADALDELEIKHSASAIDITPRGVSKASGVQVALEWTGLSPEDVLGVGDTVADQEWLAGVGWTATPGNGRQALPGLRYYAASDSTRGLVEILTRLREHDYGGL